MNDEFEEILENFLNGNISDTKKQVKALSPYDRYEFIEYLNDNRQENVAGFITRWCVIGEFK